MIFRTTALAASLVLGAMSANAQVADSPEVYEQLKTLGFEMSREMVGGTQKLYGAMHAQASMDGLVITANQSYGDHERNVLDVYAPEGAEGLPVFIFAHGGGFVRGDKKAIANISRWAALNGMIGIGFNYRFAPEATWPSGAEDVAGVLAWIQDNIAELGGDPTKIITAGNSAGSMHIADYVFREEHHIENDGVIGAVLISPPTTDLNNREIDPTRDAKYYGTDSDRAAQSVVNFVEGREIPTMVIYAENEPDDIIDQTRRLIEAITKRDGRLPIVNGVPGHSHISIVGHIGTSDTSVGPDILEFVKLQALKAE